MRDTIFYLTISSTNSYHYDAHHHHRHGIHSAPKMRTCQPIRMDGWWCDEIGWLVAILTHKSYGQKTMDQNRDQRDSIPLAIAVMVTN